MPRKILSVSEALRSPTRRRIMLYLFEKPGITLHQLAKELKMGMGNLYSHLLILDRVNLVFMVKGKGKVLVYPNESALVNNWRRSR
ncbi:MAG: hypothetical protein B6U69_02440 [Thermofilum sp. ex4484_15]|nr:MAG: hypothetical protein B6U69_02440 [Thermofilum sp. ex4484_15]